MGKLETEREPAGTPQAVTSVGNGITVTCRNSCGGSTMRQTSGKNGITLAESMIAATILIIVVVAVLTAVNAGAIQMYESTHFQRGVSLAEELIESILALPYSDPQGPSNPGPEPGETSVSLFDNADDFHGYVEQAGQLRDAAGKLYPSEYQDFRREVKAEYTTQTAAGLGTITGLMVTVTVSDKENNKWVLTRFMPQTLRTQG